MLFKVVIYFYHNTYYIILAGTPAYGRDTRSRVEEGASPSRHIILKVESRPLTAFSYFSPIIFLLPPPPPLAFFPSTCPHLIPCSSSISPAPPLTYSPPPPSIPIMILPLIFLPSLLIPSPPTPLLLPIPSSPPLSPLDFLPLLLHS